MVVLWCSHSAVGRTRLRWHRPLGMGTRSGPASREITGWCGGGGGAEACLHSLLSAQRATVCSELAPLCLRPGPLEIIGDVLGVNMFFLSQS